MKNIFENIKNFKNDTSNGKMLFFFGFYVLFFILLFLILFSNRNKNYLLQEYEQDSDTDLLDFTEVLSQNYMFDYKVIIDDVLHDYYGKRLGNVDSFKFNNNDYYYDENGYFVNQGLWIKTENPYVFYEFFNEKNVYNMYKKANNYSIISLDDGGLEYYYYLSSNTLYDIFYEQNTDYDEFPNIMIVSVDSDNHINKIKFLLDSFCNTTDKCQKSLTIEIVYDLFGEIKKIDNPLK